MGVVAVTTAADHGGHGQDLFRFHAHDGGDGFCGSVRAWNTKISLGTGFHHCLGIAITASVAAGTTVGPREAFSHGGDALIHLYFHDHRGHSQQQATDETDDGDGQDRN